MTETWKLLFVGPPGAGKTTCIAAVSDIVPISTDVGCTDELAELKETTTVALDYGELELGEQGRLLLYGLPGQARFRFMFEVVREGLLGVAILVDGTAPDPVGGLRETLEGFAEPFRRLPCVVCVNKTDLPSRALLQQCQAILGEFSVVAPIISIDARKRQDVVRIFDLLFVLLEQNSIAKDEQVDTTWP